MLQRIFVESYTKQITINTNYVTRNVTIKRVLEEA